MEKRQTIKICNFHRKYAFEVQISNTPTGRCQNLKLAGKKCEMKSRKALIKNHVYKRMCPCGEGLKCVGKDGAVGKVVGTCISTTETDESSE